jgi:aspartyl aminopeptidase
MVRKSKAEKEAVKVWKRESGWDKLPKAEKGQLTAYCRDYMDFISHAKTERLAHDIALNMARKAGYRNIEDCKALKAGDKVYRSCGGKTLFLAHVGKEALEKGLALVGAHIDSPRLDAKPSPLYQKDSLAYFDTHYYGGIKHYQWLTIPLAMYGVVYRRDGSKVNIAIGDAPDDPVFTITDLLPHLDRTQPGTTVEKAFKGEALNVIVGSIPAIDEEDKDIKDRIKLQILRELKKRYGIEEEDFFSAEIEIVPAGNARYVGFDKSMILGYGHDDRVCAYATVRALLDAKKAPSRTRVAVICDKEEIGSYGKSGMDSSFMENSVAELAERMKGGYSGLAVRRALENSTMLSADVSALHDPEFPDVSSPNNMAKLNCGIVLSKYTGARGKAGSSDASAECISNVRRIFNEAGVLWQAGELGKVDVGGGGTIALYLARYGMDVVDCGVGLFSMHAPLETAGVIDIYMAYRAYKAFYEAY